MDLRDFRQGPKVPFLRRRSHAGVTVENRCSRPMHRFSRAMRADNPAHVGTPWVRPARAASRIGHKLRWYFLGIERGEFFIAQILLGTLVVAFAPGVRNGGWCPLDAYTRR